MKKTFYVAFDTKEMPGAIVAIKISIEKEFVSGRDLGRPLPINLCRHPLYHHLEKYVLANPSQNTGDD